MIRFIENQDVVLQYPESDVFAARIFAALATYGTGYGFLRFWIQETEGRFTACISALDSDFTLSFLPDANREELAAFLCAIGFSTLQCSSKFYLDRPFTEGFVMSLIPQKETLPNDPAAENPYPCTLDDVYRLNTLQQAGIDYRTWYADLFRRCKKGTAKVFGLSVQNRVVSTASVTACTVAHTVIGCVATEPRWRRRGYAAQLLTYLVSQSRTGCFLLCEAGLLPFYQKAGFQIKEQWRQYYNETLLSSR